MKKIFGFLVLFCLVGFACFGDEITFNGTKYVQVFEDEFEGDKLDSSKWEKCPEWQRQDHGGYWRHNCSKVEDGKLVIEATKSGSTWVSGAVRSRARFEQNGGVYQIRFKIDKKTEGLWYAFWLMGHTVNSVGSGAVDGGEIDIFEVIPADPWARPGQKMYLNSAVHWDGYGSAHKSCGSKFYIDDSFYDQWHTVTFEWTPEYYKAYLDESETPYWNTEGQAQRYGGIVTKKNYMKITAEFGKWAGNVNAEALPAHMYVDWVKVYKRVE